MTRPRLLAGLCTPLAAAAVVLVGVAACGESESPHRATGERLWREAVWNMDSRSFAEAIPHLQQAVVEADGQPDRNLLFLMGSAYLFDGHFEAAADYVDALRFGPPAPEPMLLDGWELALAHARPDAELAFGACLDRTPHDHPFAGEIAYLAFFWRGEERLFHGNLDGAIADLDAAYGFLQEQGAPPNRRLVRSLNDAYRTRGEFDVAEVLVRDAAARDPSHGPFAYDLALILAAQGKPDESRQWLLAAVDRDPQLPGPYIKLARIAWAEGELDTMRRHLERYGTLTGAEAMIGRDPRANVISSEIASGLGFYWTERAKLHEEDGAEDQAALAYGLAKDAYRRALALNPSCRRSLYRLIQLGARTEEPADVMDGWKRALEEIERIEGEIPDAPDAPDAAAPGRTFC